MSALDAAAMASASARALEFAFEEAASKPSRPFPDQLADSRALACVDAWPAPCTWWAAEAKACATFAICSGFAAANAGSTATVGVVSAMPVDPGAG